MKKLLFLLLPVILLIAGCGDSSFCNSSGSCSNVVVVSPNGQGENPSNQVTPPVQPDVQQPTETKYILRGHVDIILFPHGPKATNPIGQFWPMNSLSNAVVTATNGMQTYVTFTDEKGNFEFRNVVHSDYLLTVDRMLAAHFKAPAIAESFLPENDFFVSNNHLVLDSVDSILDDLSVVYDLALMSNGDPATVGSIFDSAYIPDPDWDNRTEENAGSLGYFNPMTSGGYNPFILIQFMLENAEALRGVAVVSDSNFVTVGYTKNYLHPNFQGPDDIVVNHSEDGTADGIIYIMSKEENSPFYSVATFNYGGTEDDYLNAVAIAPNGDIWCVGKTHSNDGDISKNHGGYDGWVLHLNSDGTLKKSLTFGGAADDVLNSLVISGDKIWCVGTSASNDGDLSSNHGDSDGWVLCLNKDGGVVYNTLYGGSAKDGLSSIAIASDSTVWCAGTTYSSNGDLSSNHGDSDGWVLHLNADGSLNSSKNYGGSSTDKLNGITVAAYGNILCAGSTKSADGDLKENKGGEDAWVLHLNTDASLVSSKNYGASGDDYFYSVKADGAAGVFSGGTTSVDLPIGLLTQRPTYGQVGWVIKIHPLELTLDPEIEVQP